jgi:N-acetylneuraminate lyase
MSLPAPLTGLVPAVLTPFDAGGELNLAAVEPHARLLLGDGVSAVFVGGTTGESASLTVEERLRLAERWAEVAAGTPLRVVVHVGTNSVVDSRALASAAEATGVAAIATIAPNYFKPATPELLIEWCAQVAAAAPNTPFYFYDIPAMTGVRFPMPEFLEAAADRIPTLDGLKFTNPDLMAFQRLLRVRVGRFDVLWGTDEYLLAALALGGRGAVGSTYNFAAPVYHRMIAAFNAGDLPAARAEQYRAVDLIGLLFEHGFLAAAKEAMRVRGVDLGPVRLPNANLTPERAASLRCGLDRLGFPEMKPPA